jgi:tRNA-2-methylthio-N6-dimethylallyladenosine synthase
VDAAAKKTRKAVKGIAVARKYLVETFGCQMNVHDSERIAGLLEHDGYEPANSDADADVVVINTCSVREHAEEKLYTRLGELRELAASRPNGPVIAVAGCVAQQEGASLLKYGSGVDVVLGTQALKHLPDLIAKTTATHRPVVDVSPHDDVSFPLGVTIHADPIRARVTIIEGCNDFCSFCVVPYTRGHERMRPVADILADVERATATGHIEIQLLGQIVNHYQAPDDRSCDFAELLARVSAVPGVRRLRFASPHPRHVSDRLIDAIRDLPVVCKHLHLPVQSGSNRVLTAMRRRYTRESYFELVDRLRARVPGITISTDMIVGFPGESAEDFDQTLDLVRRVRFHSMFSFKYSPRPNTLAGKRLADDVTEAEKTTRIVELQQLQAQIQTELHAAMVGERHIVLADGISRRRRSEISGRTSGNSIVNFPGADDQIGQLIEVAITGFGPNSLRGEATAKHSSEIAEASHAR